VSGTPLLCFGAPGSGDGQFNLPWGLTVGSNGDVYVADWGNDRIQRFAPNGAFVASYGEPGRGDGQFTRPASVAVDPEGYMYIADWGNERVQVLAPDGGFVQNLRGEATLSTWASNFLNINKEEGAARARANLEPEIALNPDDPHEVSSHIEKYFWSPMSVKLDEEGQLYVTESNRHRIQIYGRTA
jgi:DNA-binding beta-propeller fold protein YncE